MKKNKRDPWKKAYLKSRKEMLDMYFDRNNNTYPVTSYIEVLNRNMPKKKKK